MSSPAGVSGAAAAGYGRVADVFADNLRYGGEVGTVCAVYVDGDLVVDLWGGQADPDTQAPWSDQTIVMVYSTTKGLTAMCVLLLAQRVN